MEGIRTSEYIRLQPRQLECYQMLNSGCRIFYGGARGGGKSHLALASCVLLCQQFDNIRCVIVRKHFSELEELFIQKLQEYYPADIFGYKYREAHKTARFSNGSRIIFRAAERQEDVDKVKGLEYHFMVIDEANEFEEMAVHKFMGSLRNANIIGYNPTILMTGNPGGKSDLYFKTHFINPDYKYWDVNELKFKDKYKFISASVYDNQYLVNDDNYISNLEGLPDSLRKAWLDGNWDVFEGQFFEEWMEDVHTVDEFPIPPHWERYGGMDIGSSKEHPTVYLRAAQDPKDLTLYVYGEYACEGSIEQAIYDIKEIDQIDFVPRKIVDPSAFKRGLKLHYADMTVGQMFLNEGVVLEQGNNERVNGWRIVKAWLHWRTTRRPKLRIMRNCTGLIRTLPQLRYDKAKKTHSEDLDTTMSDDYADALRYMLVTIFGLPLASLLEENEKMYADDNADENNLLDAKELFRRFATTERLGDIDIGQKYNHIEEFMSWV